MSALIRRGEGLSDSNVQTPRWRSLTEVEHETAEPIRSLEQERIEALEQTVADLRRRHGEEIAAAREHARREAEAAYVRDQSEALATLERALEQAALSLTAAIDGLERLAPALCEAALAPILSPTGHYRRLIESALARELAALRSGSVVRAVVSGADFDDDEALAAIAARHPSVSIVRDKVLASGHCRIELCLGEIEIDLPAYWSALQRQLHEMARQA
ncbi:MAG TPA: hypothetical protein VEA80_00800 [Vitreimonas sp.]|uniref:hypothetical protein n=1 Tax=Vitreimonas sp. TaxID=3069702 RepID=UPI002D4B5B16|nr:hypothetical protein [Vitreimonas sp.]HYD85989.1 hypothetical protein [Vitreimonas sp.]